MPDSDKVIKGLETIRYNLLQMKHMLLADFCDDALDLLKEQEHQIEYLEYSLGITESNLRHYINGND